MASTTEQTTPEDTEVTKRHLKFLMFLIEAATKDPEWNIQLKDLAQQFGEVEQ
jgi:hypothetical protein